MADKSKLYPNPKFESVEEERKYWETHSPLSEGYPGKVQRARQKRSSYLAIRLSGEEITRLRDAAARNGVGPSTYARHVLMSAIGGGARMPKVITLEELGTTIEQQLPQAIRERMESLVKAISIGDAENPALLLIDKPQMKAWEGLVENWLLPLLLSLLGVKVVSPQDEDFQRLKLERSQTSASEPHIEK